MTYTAEERQAYFEMRDYLREQIKELAESLRPLKVAVRKGEASQIFVRTRRNSIRALYLLYGLLRGKAWSYIEAGHEEPVPSTRAYITMEWARMTKAGITATPPECISSWVG